MISKLIETALGFLSPFLTAIATVASEYFLILWEGLKSVLSNWKATVFTLTLGAVIGLGVSTYVRHDPKTCRAAIKDLHNNYTFVPKKKEFSLPFNPFKIGEWF